MFEATLGNELVQRMRKAPIMYSWFAVDMLHDLHLEMLSILKEPVEAYISSQIVLLKEELAILKRKVILKIRERFFEWAVLCSSHFEKQAEDLV